MDVRAEARITGVVQRVGYRAWTERTARGLGLRGWVQNEDDGTVSAVFVGSPDRVDDMLGRCQDGPDLAVVSEVAATKGPPRDDESFTDFLIRR